MFKVKTEANQRIKTLMPGDYDWFITTDNINVTPRAAFNINKECPKEYAEVIRICVSNGWLKPVAHMKESEYMWEKLGG